MILRTKTLVQSFSRYKLKPHHPLNPFEFYHVPLFLNTLPFNMMKCHPFSFPNIWALKDDIYKDGQ